MDIRRILDIDRRFFERYQRQLLWVTNTRVGRWYFRIDAPADIEIDRFRPNAIEWQNPDGSRIARIRSSNRYANRLKWTLRHVQAFLMAATLGSLAKRQESLALSFMFAGITVSYYPDAHPETTSVDGSVEHTSGGLGTGVAWTTLRSAAGTAAADGSSSANVGWAADNVSNQWRIMRRAIFLFDTSAIQSASTISAASFIFSLTSKSAPTDTDTTKRQLRVTASLPATNTALIAADFASVGSTGFGNILYADASTSVRNTIALDASGISNVTKGGISKFGMRCGADCDNTAPTWGSFDTLDYTVSCVERTGTENDPELSLTYNALLTVSETVSMSDSVQKQPRQTRAETIGSTDSQSSLLVKVLTVSDTGSMADSLGPKSISRAVSDSASMSDAIQKSPGRTIIDIFSTSDSFSSHLTAMREFLETVTMRDVLFFWRERTKPTASWAERSAESTSWTERAPPTTPWS